MTYTFQGSNNYTLGVEIELQIIDPQTLDLSPQSEKILPICEDLGLDRVKMEIHKSMIEVNSIISKDVKDCSSCLNATLFQLNEVVENLGLQLGVTGTHPFQKWSQRQISDDNRYRQLYDKFQWLIRRMNIYGMHVHVGVPSGDRALKISQAMIQYLPHLLALSANSPFWQGVDTGMASTRVNILDTFPFSGLPPNISKWKEFEKYCATLSKVGAITTFKDLYWYIRPNCLYGTLEVRICDAMPTLQETMAVVALIQCLIVKIDQDLQEEPFKKWTNQHHWIAPENQWIAARNGLNGHIITDLKGKRQKISDAIFELVDSLSPLAKDLNCLEELLFIKTMLFEETGFAKQRRIYQETNSLKLVVKETQKEFISSLQKLHPPRKKFL